jgi:hypothetical protein
MVATKKRGRFAPMVEQDLNFFKTILLTEEGRRTLTLKPRKLHYYLLLVVNIFESLFSFFDLS